MLNAATAAALDRIARRANDVLHAYEPGFAPADGAAASTRVRALPQNDPLAVVAPEGAYFLTPAADGAARYSRDGGFRVVGGALVSRDGSPVFGYAAGAGGRLAPLRIDSVDRAVGGVGNPRVERDGTFCYTRTSLDPRSGAKREERVDVGRVALARFPAGTLPVRLDGTHVGAPSGVSPHVGRPADGNFAALAVGARDLGGVDILAGLRRLQEAYMNFEALDAARQAGLGVEKTSLDLVK